MEVVINITYMRKKKLINTIQLFNEFRFYGFNGNDVDKYTIEAIENYAIENYPNIIDNDIRNLNQKIMMYMVSKNEKDYSKYISYLLGSRLLKPLNINLTIIKLKVEKELNEMENLLNELNNKTTQSKKLFGR